MTPAPSPIVPSRSKSKIRSGRLQALMILLICAAPIIGGTVAFNIWDGGPTSNYGELIAPKKVEVAGHGVDRQSAALSNHDGKWRFVMFDGGQCDEQCRRKLLYTRQIRLAQGREQTRIERIWFIDDRAPPNPDHAAFYGDVHIIIPESSSAAAEFASQGSARQYIYLVDPHGHLMMRYSSDPDPARMIKDLQRLLKYSRIG